MPDPTCPCGTKLPFGACCKPYLDGAAEAATPEILMRSRYTAYTRGDYAYLKRTWHPSTVPTFEGETPGTWAALTIVKAGGTQVEFIAKLIVGDQLALLHEVSDFEKVDGRWVYRAGTFKGSDAPPKKIGMKDPCPCGSGDKFKRCHFER